jgi:hypothetical protein
MEQYSFEKAHEEALKMQDKIKTETEDYSEAEVLVRIEELAKKISEIAKIFHINTEAFSIQGDLKFAEEEFEKQEFIKKYCEIKGINFEEFAHSQTTLKSPKIANLFKLVKIENDYQDYTFNIQAQEIKEHGSVTSLGHDNFRTTMDGAINIAFTSQEREALKFIAQSRIDIKYKLEADLMMTKVNESLKDNSEIKKFVDWISVNNRNVNGKHDIGNILMEMEKDGIGHNEITVIQSLLDKIAEAPKTEKLVELEVLTARVFTYIAKIFNQRMAYLIDRANSGDPLFEKSSDSPVIKMSSDFEFTEEDARKAVELNLPWSKLEKEIAK